MEAIARGIDAAVDAIGRIAAWFCFVLVLVMAGNVLARYGFSAGTVWAQELEWHLMSPIALIGMSYALRHGEHVRVDVLFSRFPPRVQAVIDMLAALFAIVVAVLIIHFAQRYVGQSFAQNEGSANPGGIPFRWALKALMPIGFALLALQSVSGLIRAAQRFRDA
ncbi:TRAP transporter small permease subunit [Elioraea rosea]|uniref:TRAP transporter small permease subunit n=1 Tax=Elioraea rosea TaxID=2492390 RepID=UPI00118340B9|nr:TRAP transporter small permease subunit [Elioraea rosea]